MKGVKGRYGVVFGGMGLYCDVIGLVRAAVRCDCILLYLLLCGFALFCTNLTLPTLRPCAVWLCCVLSDAMVSREAQHNTTQ